MIASQNKKINISAKLRHMSWKTWRHLRLNKKTTYLGFTWLNGMLRRSAMSSTVSFPSEMMPTPLAMALAVIGWSPVTMITWAHIIVTALLNLTPSRTTDAVWCLQGPSLSSIDKNGAVSSTSALLRNDWRVAKAALRTNGGLSQQRRVWCILLLRDHLEFCEELGAKQWVDFNHKQNAMT